MTKSDASRIQGGQAKAGNDMTGFAARAQGAGDRNAGQPKSGGNSGNAGAGANSEVKK
ncbi:hypothetical protein G6O67_004118 [Ophiocordyceps sinensis]|uniref:SMP domain-containing protein n=1 Tax=Ophiocordyceps sinensis TaxID=72228 RepID=A0A8H4PNT5_9HYPO|nr:hypothetical protein G6O67_004118 [Ophiocordyceps sinensis]